MIVAQLVQMYTATSLSRQYLSETKDILYCDAESSTRRQAVQYVLSQILLNYLSMLSPLIPLYTEEAWHFSPAFLKREDAVYKMGWFAPKDEWCQPELARDMEMLEPLKERVLGILEQARQKQLLGNSLQADLVVIAPQNTDGYKLLAKYGMLYRTIADRSD